MKYSAVSIPTTAEAYEALLKSHDWAYQHSEDPAVWRKGAAETAAINIAAAKFDPDHTLLNCYKPD